VRYREERPGDPGRARAAVAAWRAAHPRGTRDQMLAALGPRFHPDYGTVLRGVLWRVDRDRGRQDAEARTAR
jgi:hypothetical protein